jgi:transposase
LAFFLTPGQATDIKGAVMLAASLTSARYLLADKAYDADHWRSYLKSQRIKPVIPNKSNRKQPHPFNKTMYNGRNIIERMFGRLKDFHRVATRHNKNAENFLAGICLAALICYWI